MCQILSTWHTFYLILPHNSQTRWTIIFLLCSMYQIIAVVQEEMMRDWPKEICRRTTKQSQKIDTDTNNIDNEILKKSNRIP